MSVREFLQLSLKSPDWWLLLSGFEGYRYLHALLKERSLPSTTVPQAPFQSSSVSDEFYFHSKNATNCIDFPFVKACEH